MGARESVQILNKDQVWSSFPLPLLKPIVVLSRSREISSLCICMQYLVMLSNADTEEHRAGEKWIVRGPARYIPVRDTRPSHYFFGEGEFPCLTLNSHPSFPLSPLMQLSCPFMSSFSLPSLILCVRGCM